MSTRYIEITVKTALNRVQSAAYPGMKWSLNPYRGCKHDCVYCYARYTHEFLEQDPTADFSRTVFVKRNLVQALRADLRRPSWKREKVCIGTATDPYQPIEGRYRLTRDALHVLRDQLTPASLVTKNTMALRDADIMASLARVAGFTLAMTIITLDEALARQLEPDAPTPMQRLRVVRELTQVGVPVSVAIAPILPGVTDREEQLRDLIQAAYDHGADVAFHQTFRMYAATRSHFFRYLAERQPHLVAAYRRAYASAQDAPAEYRLRLARRIERIRRELAPRRPPPVMLSPEPVQLSLGL
ncbi:MAG: radical SAM protein [Chloroflexi bacterium]|nr:radical SAM protein [Chloroflexota bacterium]